MWSIHVRWDYIITNTECPKNECHSTNRVTCVAVSVTAYIRASIWKDDTWHVLFLGRKFVIVFQNNGIHLSFSLYCLDYILIIYNRIVCITENYIKAIPLSICYIITCVLLLVTMDGSQWELWHKIWRQIKALSCLSSWISSMQQECFNKMKKLMWLTNLVLLRKFNLAWLRFNSMAFSKKIS